MKKKLRQSVYIIIPLFLALILIVSNSCTKKQKIQTVDDITDSTLLPDSELFGATTYLYEGSRKTTKIVTKTLRRFEKLDSIMAYDVNAVIFDSIGGVSSTVVGDSGLIREDQSKLELFSNVFVVSHDSIKLETEHLYWNSTTQKIESDVFVKITKESNIWTGTGLEADKDLYPFKILNASGTLHDTKELEK